MQVHRIPVESFPVLRAMRDFLRGLGFAGAEVRKEGNVNADIAAGPLPAGDRPQPAAVHRAFLPHPDKLGAMPDGACRISAVHYYPADGGLGWHTDSGAWGWRVYVVLPLDGRPGAFFTGESPQGWVDDTHYANAFYVTHEPPYSWHAVRAWGPRLSIGVRIKSAAIAASLGLVQ